MLYLASQDADIIGHHVIEGLELLLDSLQLHSLRLSLFGPVDNNTILKVNLVSYSFSHHDNMLLTAVPRQTYLLLSNSFCQQSFLAFIPLFDYLLLLLQKLQTRLLPSVIKHKENLTHKNVRNSKGQIKH